MGEVKKIQLMQENNHVETDSTDGEYWERSDQIKLGVIRERL
jgi:hypothetical protein